MTSVLGLVALAVYLIGGRHLSPLGPLGVGGFVFITIFWGTRNAARSVIGEIRERTWDFQRLSAVSPASMTVGKLVGSTSYTWYGGLLCLLIAASGLSRMMDAAEVAAWIGVLIASGLLAHGVALGSALTMARRRRADARMSVLPHQAAGLLAAVLPSWLVGAVGRRGFDFQALREISWYGSSFDALEFTAIATAVFAVWAIIGCWREMRLELMETNTPIFWPVFLAFLALFLAGFGRASGQGLALAYAGVHVATLVALIAEPKNTVELRALGAAARQGRLWRVATGMPAYGWAFLAAVVLAIALVTASPVRTIGGDIATASLAIAALGFLARDIGVFHFFHAKPRQMRGDFASLVSLGLLYVVGGGLASVINEPAVTALVAPTFDAPAWAAVLPWAEAVAIWALAVARFRGARVEAAPMAASV
jgi:hypothetical protein